MIHIRPAHSRGQGHSDWLDTYHSFSFGDYHDPERMGYSCLRVINEDYIAPSGGFPTHGHQDMEIVTYVLEGALQHRDSLGHGTVIKPGEVQRMSAGRGIRHSEYNPSPSQPTHLVQIWLLPAQTGLPPSYEQVAFAASELAGHLRLLASPDGKDGSVTIHQDAWLFAGRLDTNESVSHQLAAGRRAYVQVLRGALLLNTIPMTAGDGAAIAAEETLHITAPSDMEVLLFGLP